MRIGTGKPIIADKSKKKVNQKVKQAIGRAQEMRNNPSWLEKQMMRFLDDRSVRYMFQKIFYIRNYKDTITHYYITDFYIPEKNLIVEVDGKYHKDQIEKDDNRTRDIMKHYPGIKLIRVCYDDFKSPEILDKISRYVMSRNDYHKMFDKK